MTPKEAQIAFLTEQLLKLLQSDTPAQVEYKPTPQIRPINQYHVGGFKQVTEDDLRVKLNLDIPYIRKLMHHVDSTYGKAENYITMQGLITEIEKLLPE